MNSDEEKTEDARIRRVLPACAIVGALISYACSRHVIAPPLAYALAVLAGIVAAAVEAPTLHRQILYSIPFMVLCLGEVGLCAWLDKHTSHVLKPKEWMSGAVVGASPGVILYMLARWKIP